jgi:hypothetical protein
MIGNKNIQKVFTEVPDISLQKVIFPPSSPPSPKAKVLFEILENY